MKIYVFLSNAPQYAAIQFACDNKRFGTTKHAAQKALYLDLKQIKNVTLLLQDWSDGVSLEAIFKAGNNLAQNKILAVAKKHSIKTRLYKYVDIIDAEYIRMAKLGKHPSQVRY